MKINNMPNYAREYAFVVARIVNGEAWFYGAYNAENTAATIARDVNGIVVRSEVAEAV